MADYRNHGHSFLEYFVRNIEIACHFTRTSFGLQKMIQHLPSELLGQIFHFLVDQYDLRSIESVLCVCKRWNLMMEAEQEPFGMNCWMKFLKENRWTCHLPTYDSRVHTNRHVPTLKEVKEIYRDCRLANEPIPCQALTELFHNLVQDYPRYKTCLKCGIYLKTNHAEEMQEGALRYFSHINIRSPYIIETLSGLHSDTFEVPDHVIWHIPDLLTYANNPFPCPNCLDCKKGMVIIYIFHYDQSHDWGTIVEYKCRNCQRILSAKIVLGA